MSHTIVGGNADRPDNIHTFPRITNTGTSEVMEIDGVVITTVDSIAGGQVTYQLQGSLDGTNFATLDEAKTKDIGNHIHTYNGYALRYLRVVVTASAAGRTLDVSICCDS
jgi:hypothetical protein